MPDNHRLTLNEAERMEFNSRMAVWDSKNPAPTYDGRDYDSQDYYYHVYDLRLHHELRDSVADSIYDGILYRREANRP